MQGKCWILPVFKVLGIVVLSLSLCAFGFLKALSLKIRERQLISVTLGVGNLIRSIENGAQELSVILPICFSECDFLCINGCRVECESSYLDERDLQLVNTFFAQLGHGFKSSEIDRAGVYMGLLQERSEIAKAQNLGKARLWQTLGVSLGAAAFILLI